MELRWSAPGGGVKQLPSATFLPLLRKAVETAPDRADLQVQLAWTLFRADLMTELVDRFGPLRDDPAANPELLFAVARAAISLGDDELMLAALRASAAQGFEPAFRYLAESFARLDRPDDALDAALRALDRTDDSAALRIVAHVLLARGERERLWMLCAKLRARGAYGAYLPSVMAFAASTPEDAAEVAALVDEPRWFSAAPLGVPDDFNRALAAELREHRALSSLPSTKATVGAGNRIDQLHLVGGPLTRDLLAKIRDAVDVYAAQRQAFASHPMIALRPAAVALNAWAVLVHDHGHETWHLHPAGWLSGVYYVEVPRVEASAGGHPGAIEFGPHPVGAERPTAGWPRRLLTPEAGQLLLFPSYYGHRTWPTGVAESRICVAFDVVPSEAR